MILCPSSKKQGRLHSTRASDKSRAMIAISKRLVLSDPCSRQRSEMDSYKSWMGSWGLKLAPYKNPRKRWANSDKLSLMWSLTYSKTTSATPRRRNLRPFSTLGNLWTRICQSTGSFSGGTLKFQTEARPTAIRCSTISLKPRAASSHQTPRRNNCACASIWNLRSLSLAASRSQNLRRSCR